MQQSPGARPGFTGFTAIHHATDRRYAQTVPPDAGRQASILNALLTPFLSGSALSLATRWDSAVSSLPCSVKASSCLRVGVLVRSTASDSDLTVRSWPAKSNAELVLARAISSVFMA